MGKEGQAPLPDPTSLWNYELPPANPGRLDDDEGLKALKTDKTKIAFKPKITSVSGSFDAGCQLDLRKIAEKAENVEYNSNQAKRKRAPLVLRIKKPRATAMVFKSGRVSVSGVQSERECKKAAKIFVEIMKSAGHEEATVANFRTRNVSASCCLDFHVRINKLAEDETFKQTFSQTMCYEPEMYPGLLISLQDPKVKMIIFCTGSVILTGARSSRDIQTALEKLYPLAVMYAP